MPTPSKFLLEVIIPRARRRDVSKWTRQADLIRHLLFRCLSLRPGLTPVGRWRHYVGLTWPEALNLARSGELVTVSWVFQRAPGKRRSGPRKWYIQLDPVLCESDPMAACRDPRLWRANLSPTNLGIEPPTPTDYRAGEDGTRRPWRGARRRAIRALDDAIERHTPPPPHHHPRGAEDGAEAAQDHSGGPGTGRDRSGTAAVQEGHPSTLLSDSILDDVDGVPLPGPLPSGRRSRTRLSKNALRRARMQAGKARASVWPPEAGECECEGCQRE